MCASIFVEKSDHGGRADMFKLIHYFKEAFEIVFIFSMTMLKVNEGFSMNTIVKSTGGRYRGVTILQIHDST